MYLRKIQRPKGIYLAIQESVYDSSSKQSRTKTIQSLGYIDDLKKEFPDPVSHFEQVVAQKNEERKANASRCISIDTSTSLKKSEHNLKNVGYSIFKQLYKALKLDLFWKNESHNRSFCYDAGRIFLLLTISRLLFPASKKETYEKRETYFEVFDGFSLDDVYACLDFIDEKREKLQKWIFDYSKALFPRDLSVSYFDCTNYYYDIGNSDMDTLGEDGCPIDKKGNKTEKRLRKRGPEKNHRPDPIVEMGLLMDRNGIPVAFDLFPGNESEKIHMLPAIRRIKQQYTSQRIIVVADRGLNTSDNIYYLNGDNKADANPYDGYVYGQSVRGADAEFKAWVLKEGYLSEMVRDETGREIRFTHKSRIHPKTLHVHVGYGNTEKKKAVVVDQKQMVYYSEKYAKKQKRDRLAMVERARDMIRHPSHYTKATHGGSASYIKNISFSKDTGEIVDGSSLELDVEKIMEEEKYDGYYSIVTSELKMDDREMREIYRGLARIEDTFKISKSELEARPAYVWTNSHIRAHFTTCFTALVLIRLLETKLGNRYPAGQILESIRQYNCVQIDSNLYQFLYYDDILEECGRLIQVEFHNKYRNRMQIRRMLHY